MEKTFYLNSKVLSVVFFLSLMLITYSSYAFTVDRSKDDGEKTYLITFPHTMQTCLTLLDKISEDDSKLLSKIDWGCMSGDHTGYMIVQSKDESSALEMLPASLRDDAKIEKVDKFTKEQIASFHKKHK